MNKDQDGFGKTRSIIGGSYSYWNNIPKIIPEDMKDLTSKEIKQYLTKWRDSVWTKNVKDNTQRLKNIKDIPIINEINIDQWTMDRLKEASALYVEGFFVASIALCGIIAEFNTFKLLEDCINRNGIEHVIEYSKKFGNQVGRIETLKKIDEITENGAILLKNIKDIRNQYIHSGVVDHSGFISKEDNLKILKALIEFLNTHHAIYNE